MTQLAQEQANCSNCAAAEQAKVLRVILVQLEGQEVKVDVSSGVMQPLSLRQQVFDVIHNVAHPGIRATRRLIASRYLWPKLAANVAEWCKQCQRAKTTKHAKPAIQPMPVPTARFSHFHVDLVGPLPASEEGYFYLFTAIDCSTRWAEAFPLKLIAPPRWYTAG
jgi:hypothetical protein